MTRYNFNLKWHMNSSEKETSLLGFLTTKQAVYIDVIWLCRILIGCLAEMSSVLDLMTCRSCGGVT